MKGELCFWISDTGLFGFDFMINNKTNMFINFKAKENFYFRKKKIVKDGIFMNTEHIRMEKGLTNEKRKFVVF